MKLLDTLLENDPEFTERFQAFALDEVVHEPGQELDETTRCLAIIAALLGSGSADMFADMLPSALEGALTPAMVKETVYQAVAYLGIGRVLPFLTAANRVFGDLDIPLPLPDNTTTTLDNRLEKGTQEQVAIFGAGMKDFWKSGHINRWLAANCFGDYYTRGELDLKQREIITFCFLMAQGGCEPQLGAHIQGNVNVGNDKAFLLKVVSQCLPYIGYPRSLNAIALLKQP